METGAGLGVRVENQEQQEHEPKNKAVVLDQNRNRKMRVMVAIDESDESWYALEWLLDNLIFATSTSSNQPSEESSGLVILVHVTPPFSPSIMPMGPGGAAFYTPPALIESVRKAQAENASVLLSRALQMCKEKMVKAETMVLEGDAKDMICQATEQVHVDLLVVGSRGLGKIRRAFLGSVSDYCAHHAKCPIVIVKPPKELREKKESTTKAEELREKKESTTKAE